MKLNELQKSTILALILHILNIIYNTKEVRGKISEKKQGLLLMKKAQSMS